MVNDNIIKYECSTCKTDMTKAVHDARQRQSNVIRVLKNENGFSEPEEITVELQCPNGHWAEYS